MKRTQNKPIKRQLLSVTLVVTFLLHFGQFVFAQTTPLSCQESLTVGSTKVCQQYPFDLTISNSGLDSNCLCPLPQSAIFTISYDATNLQYESLVVNKSNLTSQVSDNGSGNIVVQLYQQQGQTDSLGVSGKLVTLKFIPKSSGTYIVKIANASFGSITTGLLTSGTVTVNSIPTVTVSALPTAVCTGQSTVLSATGGTTYLWSSGTTTASTNTVTPSLSTTYTVTGTNASSCSATSSVVVTVNSLPTATVNSGALNNGSFTLTATASGNAPFGYSWSNTAVNSNTNTVTLPGTYTVTVSDVNGCKVSTSGTVTLLSSVINVCSPQTGVNLNAGNFASYVWTGPGLAANTTWNPVWVIATGTYYVTATATTGLKYTSSTTVTIHPAFTPTITSNVNGVNTTVTNGVVENCPGTQFNLTANAGETQYIWNGVTGTANYVTATTVTSTINLVEVDQYGCTSNAEYVNLEYYTVSPAIISQTAILTGTNSITLTSSGSTVVWSTSATSSNIAIYKAGTYTVTVTDGNGCKSVSSVTEALNTYPLSISKQAEPSGIELIAQPNGLNEYYQWYNINAPTQILGGGNTLNVTTEGIYGVTAYINDTKVASTTDTVVLNTSTNILKSEVVIQDASPTAEPEVISTSESETKATVSVVPQPARDEVRVISTSPVKTVIMYDLNGKVVVSVKNITIIDVSMLPSATYQMVIETDAGIFSKTVVVIK